MSFWSIDNTRYECNPICLYQWDVMWYPHIIFYLSICINWICVIKMFHPYYLFIYLLAWRWHLWLIHLYEGHWLLVPLFTSLDNWDNRILDLRILLAEFISSFDIYVFETFRRWQQFFPKTSESDRDWFGVWDLTGSISFSLRNYIRCMTQHGCMVPLFLSSYNRVTYMSMDFRQISSLSFEWALLLESLFCVWIFY